MRPLASLRIISIGSAVERAVGNVAEGRRHLPPAIGDRPETVALMPSVVEDMPSDLAEENLTKRSRRPERTEI